MKNLLGVLSFGLSGALAEHAFINMAENQGIFRLDNPIPWFVIVPFGIATIYYFFASDKEPSNEKTNR